jgi:hypothetical protein
VNDHAQGEKQFGQTCKQVYQRGSLD